MNFHRINRLILDMISKLRLDLSGLTVLTESATGYYALTPIIAALAGADAVYAMTRNSRFGTMAEVVDLTTALIRQFQVDGDIHIITDRRDKRIEKADIVTNLGFVRPMDKVFLRRLKSTAVIPLMWETWEYRRADLDLPECRSLGIPVLGTNEKHPDLLIFNYIGHLALKLLLALDIELFKAEIVVIGGGEFGRSIIAVLTAVGANVIHIQPIETGHTTALFANRDAVVVADHETHRPLICPDGLFSPEDLQQINPGLSFAHISGHVDRTALREAGFRCVPEIFAQPGYMSVATDDLGPRPLVELHTAGLKVGEMMARESNSNRRGLAVELSVLEKSDLAQGFKGVHL